MPPNAKFLHGTTYLAYSVFADAAGVVFTVGIVWAIVRRYVQRPYRIRIKTKPEYAAILGTFLVIGVSGFFAEAFRIAEIDQPSYEKWSFVGYPMSHFFNGLSVDTLDQWHQIMWSLHVARVRRVPGTAAHHDAAAHVHVSAQHVSARS